MAAVAVNVVRRRQKCLKGKIYLKGRYSNMKKFLAIFMVVAVVMGMAFVVMSSADEAVNTFTVNVSEPVDGKATVSIDVNAKAPLTALQMRIQFGEGTSMIQKSNAKQYYKNVYKTDEDENEYGWNLREATLYEADKVQFTAADSAGNIETEIGGTSGMFPSNPKGIIVFDINVSGEITEDTVKVIFIKTTSDATVVSSTVNYNLPAAPTTTTETPVPTTTETPVPTTTETPVPTTTETPVPTTTEAPVPTTTGDPDAPTTTGEEPAPTTTAKDPNTSDGSAMGMFAFIALAIASLACAVVVIVRRKRA